MSESTAETHQRAWLVGLLALLAAGGTAWMAWQVLSNYQQQLELARQPQGEVEVVVARRALPAGLPMQAEDLEVIRTSDPSGPPERLFRTVESVAGKVPAEPVLEGEPVRLERLLDGGAVMHLDAAIAPGTRAMTVRVDRAASVGGLLEPGFYVDVIVTIRPDDNSLSASWVTETILQGVRVVAINEQIAGGPAPAQADEAEREERRRYMHVTLEVDPLEAEKLALAASRGDLVLTLRHAEDEVLLDDRGPLVTNALVGLSVKGTPVSGRRSKHARVETPPPPTTSAEVMQGE